MKIKPDVLTAARKAKGLNQAELARRVGVDQSRISRMERGETGARTETLSAIARELGITLAELLGEEVRESRSDYGTGQPHKRLLSDYDTPPGLHDLAMDKALVSALDIKPEEWEALASMKLPGEVSKDGYVQLLITLRAVSS